MQDKLVLYETRDKVGIITLNRPEKLNALSKPLRQQLVQAFAEADADESTCVVVLRAAGRSFCVGFDITGGEPEKDPWRHDTLKWHETLTAGIQFQMTPWYMRKPVIASVQGYAVGGGCELAMFCDLTLAADDAKFGEPEVRFAEAGPALVMPFIIGQKRARELLYFGDMITARQALDFGMINRVVAKDELESYTLDYARRLALVGPQALQAVKQALTRSADISGFRSGIQAGLDAVAPLYAAKTEAGGKFVEIARTQGLKAALKWRNGQFDEISI
ncbi:enoyl-CoA hydratase-related protein [Orrella sp. JC864]|uniref:enoyl-CoA hydratase-related protein n=1 Tax=Orrella sp. JC864 TaxID=3120298 RepID=UPI0012BBD9CB